MIELITHIEPGNLTGRPQEFTKTLESYISEGYKVVSAGHQLVRREGTPPTRNQKKPFSIYSWGYLKRPHRSISYAGE